MKVDHKILRRTPPNLVHLDLRSLSWRKFRILLMLNSSEVCSLEFCSKRPMHFVQGRILRIQVRPKVSSLFVFFLTLLFEQSRSAERK